MILKKVLVSIGAFLISALSVNAVESPREVNDLELNDPIESINTVIIGGGHAGLSMSFALVERGVDHVVLEKGRSLEQWRSKRWDSFKVNTPQVFSRMLGQADDIPDDGIGLPLATTLASWDQHIATSNLPIREQTQVTGVEKQEDGRFLVAAISNEFGAIKFLAKNVVAASGQYQVPRIPAWANRLPHDVKQLRVGTYHNPQDLDAGAVLVVGCGQTGTQISEELLDSGKTVYIATSKVKGCPRSHRGEDLFFWLDRTEFFKLTKEALPDPAMKYGGVPITGNDHPISHFSLLRKDGILLGSLNSLSENGETLSFADNLKENVETSCKSYDMITGMFEAWIAKNCDPAKYPAFTKEAEWVDEGDFDEYKPVLSLNIKAAGIKTVIFATGWNADLSWLKIEELHRELDARGAPESLLSTTPGFFWLGFPWLQTANSANVAGIQNDVPLILENLR